MDAMNQTHVTEFRIIGFSSFHKYQLLMFVIILFAYLTTITGNLVIIAVVRLEVCLHSPMYLFVSTLSVLEIVYVSATVPKLLLNLLGASPFVSFIGCYTQLYVFHSCGISECFLLGVMAFDRYVAICRPLHYRTIMTTMVCIQLAAFPWMVGYSAALLLTALTARISFCASNEVNHFFCDLTALASLGCSDVSFNVRVNSSVAVCAVLTPLFLIIASYVQIIRAILKIKTSEGRQKAFSTCSSHLIVAGLFYGAATIVYMRPEPISTVEIDKLLALMYAIFTPMLNPFIYSLRNKDVKHAIRKWLKRMNMHRINK